jgi:hypothetical protein
MLVDNGLFGGHVPLDNAVKLLIDTIDDCKDSSEDQIFVVDGLVELKDWMPFKAALREKNCTILKLKDRVRPLDDSSIICYK